MHPRIAELFNPEGFEGYSARKITFELDSPIFSIARIALQVTRTGHIFEFPEGYNIGVLETVKNTAQRNENMWVTRPDGRFYESMGSQILELSYAGNISLPLTKELKSSIQRLVDVVQVVEMLDPINRP